MHVVQGWENDVPSHAFDCQHEFQYRRRGYRVTNLRLVGDDRDLCQAFAKHFCQSGHFRTITIGCRGRMGVNAVDVFPVATGGLKRSLHAQSHIILRQPGKMASVRVGVATQDHALDRPTSLPDVVGTTQEDPPYPLRRDEAASVLGERTARLRRIVIATVSRQVFLVQRIDPSETPYGQRYQRELVPEDQGTVDEIALHELGREQERMAT